MLWVKASAFYPQNNMVWNHCTYIPGSFPPCMDICPFIKHDFHSKETENKTREMLPEKTHNRIFEKKMSLENSRGLADVCDMTVFTRQKLTSGKYKRLLSFAFRIFYFIYMCLILHVSMSIGFFVFYNFLHSLVCLSLLLSCVIVQGVSFQIIHMYFVLKGPKPCDALWWRNWWSLRPQSLNSPE